MRRWFRRQGQEEERREEETETPLAAETEPGGEAAAESPEAGEVEAPELDTPVSEAAPLAAEAAAAPGRRGFFRRWRRETPEEASPPSPATGWSEPPGPEAGLTLEPEPEPAPPPEPEITPAPPSIPPAPQDLSAPELAPQAEPPESEDTVPAAAEEIPEAAARRGMFRRLRDRLSRTREALSGGLDRLFRGRKVVDAELLEELEELLITADLGVDTSLFLIQTLQDQLKRRELGDVERLKAALKTAMVELLAGAAPREIEAHPWVVLVVGVNGVGKTTTIAKLAHQAMGRGLTPMLVAADTFRAAAVEQLEIWGERVGAAVIKQKTGADPAAVVFDGLAAAQARNVDTVLVDTAGRLHTKVNLMEELKKIHRTAAKQIPGAPHEVLLVLDATTGQNALSQVRLFHQAVGVTGIILTKMEGTAKGGVALAVAHETGIPIRFIGVGEGMEDLRPFDPEAFVEAILG